MKFDRDRKWLFNKSVKQHTERSLKNQREELEEAKKKLLVADNDKEKEILKTRIDFLENNLKEKKRQWFTTNFQNWTISIGIGLAVIITIIIVVVELVVK